MQNNKLNITKLLVTSGAVDQLIAEYDKHPIQLPKTTGRGILGTIQQYYTIWCGYPDCPKWEDVAGATKAECAKIAKQNGWKHTKKHGWVCPKHDGL